MKYMSEHEWHCGEHRKKRSLLFRKCDFSGKSLFNSIAIRIRYYDYSGMYEDYWVSEEAYFFLVLRYGNKLLREEI